MEKMIPGYSRYKMLEDGTVKNIATGSIVKPDAHNYGRLRLINDEGARRWYDIKTEFPKLYPPTPIEVKEVKKKEPFVLPDDVAEVRKLHRAHKVTEEEVREMRMLFAQKLFRPKDAPAKYGIAAQTAGKIIQKKIYPNVD